ncbi:hypothetical protein D3C73_1191760 [compost metagenome]
MNTQATITAADVTIDHAMLETLMCNDAAKDPNDLFAHILSPTRVIDREGALTLGEVVLPQGSITSRLFTLLEETHGIKLQSEFRARAEAHPAYTPIYDELLAANRDGSLDSLFDVIESTGAVVVFDKSRSIATIGLNQVAMRSGMRERTAMTDFRNSRLIDRANGVNHPIYDFEPKRRVVASEPEMSTTFYVSFQL